MIEFRNIDHVQLTIPKGSEDIARNFYGGILGLEEIEKPDSLKPSGGIWYKTGNIELHLGISSTKTDSESDTGRKEHPAFVVKDLLEAKRHLANKRVKMKEEIEIPGRNRFSFYDPFGNRIELLEYEK